MIARLVRRIAVLLLPVALGSCLLSPGKFVSRLTINADRSFAFTYVGEVIDGERGGEGLKSTDEDASKRTPAEMKEEAAKAAAAKKETEAKRRAIAAALSKEAGYRKVTYVGEGKFLVDYAVSGRLSHDFIWPFNLDAEVIFPFIAIELRQGGVVRVKAPAFANDDSNKPQMPGMPGLPGMPGGGASGSNQLDGTFTLDTDAEIISQNNEGGVAKSGMRSTIMWRATPELKTAPTAVLKLAAAP
ncbi:MAG: hypothetical protein K2P79_11430 [Sphingomonas sp.]|nr:hypothetical protein [Sphingomonas sp.]